MKNILIVDDEPDIRAILRYNLEKEGFAITEAIDGNDALDKLSKELDLAILDIMMPGKDGYDVCRKIREQGNTLPIVLLIARINAIFRRIDQINSKGTSIRFGELEINTSTYIAQLNKEELHFPRKEFELLAFFMSQPNIIFSRGDILSGIWEEDVFVVDRTIDVHINRIRSKLGPYKNWIETVKGVGYRFRPKL